MATKQNSADKITKANKSKSTKVKNTKATDVMSKSSKSKTNKPRKGLSEEAMKNLREKHKYMDNGRKMKAIIAYAGSASAIKNPYGKKSTDVNIATDFDEFVSRMYPKNKTSLGVGDLETLKSYYNDMKGKSIERLAYEYKDLQLQRAKYELKEAEQTKDQPVKAKNDHTVDGRSVKDIHDQNKRQKDFQAMMSYFEAMLNGETPQGKNDLTRDGRSIRDIHMQDTNSADDYDPTDDMLD